jgi:hypothetical protein
MTKTICMLALGGALAVGTSGAALAQACPPGTHWHLNACYPGPAPAYAPTNPVSGAAAGAAAGAATGGAAAVPVGAIVGGALGTAAGAVGGTANMVTGAPVATYGTTAPPAAPGGCAPGYVLYAGGCYPAR